MICEVLSLCYEKIQKKNHYVTKKRMVVFNQLELSKTYYRKEKQ